MPVVSLAYGEFDAFVTELASRSYNWPEVEPDDDPEEDLVDTWYFIVGNLALSPTATEIESDKAAVL